MSKEHWSINVNLYEIKIDLILPHLRNFLEVSLTYNVYCNDYTHIHKYLHYNSNCT